MRDFEYNNTGGTENRRTHIDNTAQRVSGGFERCCRKKGAAFLFESTVMMNIDYTLNSMKEGMSARVVTLYNEGSMRRRLQDIGLIEGTEVICLHRSPSGDPIAYLIRGAVIALREEDSSKVMVMAI